MYLAILSLRTVPFCLFHSRLCLNSGTLAHMTVRNGLYILVAAWMCIVAWLHETQCQKADYRGKDNRHVG